MAGVKRKVVPLRDNALHLEAELAILKHYEAW
jgi:hypothetical protein